MLIDTILVTGDFVLLGLIDEWFERQEKKDLYRSIHAILSCQSIIVIYNRYKNKGEAK